ncbi:MAG: hypothetical protein K2W95_12165 [Candidatus Obscuribacterales bacterium]|nr:hypothetical protein [Candidatus Obscuribacterales bacterium]
MPDQNTQVRIGDVLTMAGILTAEQLDDRLEIAKTIGQPLGQTLLQLGDLSKHQLRCVVHVQSLVVDGLLDQVRAVEAIKLVVVNDITVEAALEAVGFANDSAWSARLGQLLVDSGVITRKRLARGLVCSTNQCCPLGHALIQLGLLNPAILTLALSLQRDIRTGKKTRDQALQELRGCAEVPTQRLTAEDFQQPR